VRPHHSLLALGVAAILTMLPFGLAAGEIERSPFAPIATEFLGLVHGQVAACDIVLDRSVLCFAAMPGSVVLVAEELEVLLAAYRGSLVRSAWRSGNGVHHVELYFDDDLWGVLELWLSEPGDGSVQGMLKYVTRRRNGR
jgi:hypothetical protein